MSARDDIYRVKALARHLIGYPLVEGINDPYLFKALFTCGGTGSGKTYVSNHVVKGLGLKHVNSDTIVERLFPRMGISLKFSDDPDKSARQAAGRLRAKELTDKQRKMWEDGMLGLVIDGTAKDYSRITREAEHLKALGYDVGMLFVNTSLDVALERNASRARSVASEVATDLWKKVQSNIGKFQIYFGNGNFFIIDNSDIRAGSEEADFGMGLRRLGLNWLNRPLSNEIGREKLEILRAMGGKTLSDLP